MCLSLRTFYTAKLIIIVIATVHIAVKNLILEQSVIVWVARPS